jgi:hypothetical protein
MRALIRYFAPLVLSATFVVPMLFAGCSAHVEGGRVYDSHYHDYHAWDNNEVVYYNRWETDNHKDHRDFNKRNKKDQQDYFTWRHQQDHDHH